MATFNIERVTALPGTLVANSIYLVSNGDPYTEMYVVGNTDSVVRRIINETDIQNMINASIAGLDSVQVVADIATRDALLPSTVNLQVIVVDASADSTVDSGAATYIYDAGNTTWIKISEAESLDVTLNWSDIVGGPSSSPAQIDAAVGDSHTHANKTQLDLIGQSASGDITYDGQEYVRSGATAW